MSAPFVARLLLLQRLGSNLRAAVRQSLHKIPQQVDRLATLSLFIVSPRFPSLRTCLKSCIVEWWLGCLFWSKVLRSSFFWIANHLRVTGLARLAVATTQRPQRAANEYYPYLQLSWVFFPLELLCRQSLLMWIPVSLSKTSLITGAMNYVKSSFSCSHK